MEKSNQYVIGQGFNLEELAKGLFAYLEKEEGIAVTLASIDDGYVLDVEAATTLRKVAGLEKSGHITLVLKGDVLTVSFENELWGLKKGAEIVVKHWLFPPLIIPSIMGAVRQVDFPQKVFTYVDLYVENSENAQ